MTTIQTPYTVHTEKLFRADGSEVNALATVRDDTSDVLGIVGSRYTVIQNTDLIERIEDGFSKAGLSGWNRLYRHEGAQFIARYEFPKIQREIPKVGDIVSLRLTARNSFDGTNSAKLQLGLLRLVCTNGMVAPGQQFSLTKRHSGEPEMGDILGTITQARQQFDRAVEFFGPLADRQITNHEGAKLLSGMEKADILPTRIAKLIVPVWENPTRREDNARNLWNLYNAITDVLTHQIEDRRFEVANRVNARSLMTLSDVAINQTRFDELLALAS